MKTKILSAEQIEARRNLRDQFAGQALQGFAAAWYLNSKGIGIINSDVAEDAYAMADAMLKAREA